MEKLHAFIRKTLLALVDVFYPLFKKFMPLQTFRYAAVGGANVLFDIVLYSFIYNYLTHKKVVHIGSFALKPFVFAFFISFLITFPIGFYLSRYVIWQETRTKKRVQVFRYFLIVAACVGLNYFFLNLFIEELHWWPTAARIAASVFVILFSYITQKDFSFRPPKNVQKKERE